MKAVKIDRPNHLEVIDLPTPVPGAGEVRIRVMASGICGTDIHIFRGEYLGDYPVIPGHEFSGVVDAVGEGVTRFQVGDRVAVEPNIPCDNCWHCLNNRHNFCLNWQAVGVTRPGGMAQFTTAPEKAVFSIGDLPFEFGAFMEPLSCVLHGVERLDLGMAGHVAIIGAGPIGLLLQRTIRLQGAVKVTMVERNPFRARHAANFGADTVLDSLEGLKPDHYDAVIDATGVVSVMNRMVEFARHGGKVLLFGVPPAGAQMSLEAFKIFRKGLTILGSFTSLRNSYQAIDLLKTGRLDVSDLISHRLPLDDMQAGIELIERGSENIRKVMLLPN
ncbi:MAG TPA: zinc-dependent alcohol dehydrogenase family protein [Anaerolineaceae bacterium]